MKLQDILGSKGSEVYSIEPGKRLSDVVQLLMDHRCGSLMVLERSNDGAPPRIAGIISERDILRACAERRKPLEELGVSEYMTAKLVTGSPGDSVDHTMGVMTKHRIRHLPVVDNGRLLGLISIGDLVKAHYHETQVENHQLKSYIQS